jgi:hypothetical protein
MRIREVVTAGVADSVNAALKPFMRPVIVPLAVESLLYCGTLASGATIDQSVNILCSEKLYVSVILLCMKTTTIATLPLTYDCSGRFRESAQKPGCVVVMRYRESSGLLFGGLAAWVMFTPCRMVPV